MNLDAGKMNSWVVREVERLAPHRLATDRTGIACLTSRG